MTFGSWHGVLREISTNAAAQDIPNDSPLAQFRCFTDADVAGAMRVLQELRNQRSHRWRPAAHKINDAVTQAREHLETVRRRACQRSRLT
jgi:hypothetical protein